MGDREMMACRLAGIVKRYATGTLANDRVDFAAAVGEVHALVGENGAGKTTLMRVLYGLEQPDAGTVTLWGRPVSFASPRAAIRAGIGMVHQHFMLAPSLTVAENVVLGHEPGRWRLVRPAAERAVAAVSERHRLPVDPAARVADLSVGEQQRVELIKALYRGARLLILDEPTAVLTAREANELFVAIRRLAAAGGTVIFITHRLGEVRQVADRVTVMRQGRSVGTFAVNEIDEVGLARLMVGAGAADALLATPGRANHHTGAVVLMVTRLRAHEAGHWRLDGVDLMVREREIVGIVGVEGNGQRELVETLAGLRSPTSGQVRVDGRDVTGASPRAVRAAGVGIVPEDRLGMALAARATVAENLAIGQYDQPPLARRWWLDRPAMRGLARRLMADFGVQAAGPDVPVSTLSGGNLQRLVLARELSAHPRLLIAAQPTRGLDVASSAAIHERLRAAREWGSAILLVSADLDEVTRLADRVLVLVSGRVSAAFDGDAWRQLSEEERGLYLAGVKSDRDG